MDATLFIRANQKERITIWANQKERIIRTPSWISHFLFGFRDSSAHSKRIEAGNHQDNIPKGGAIDSHGSHIINLGSEASTHQHFPTGLIDSHSSPIVYSGSTEAHLHKRFTNGLDSHGPPIVYSDAEGATHQRTMIGSSLDSRGSPIDSHGSPIVYSNAEGATHQHFPNGSTLDSHGSPI
eukprot:scaffold121841_cov37-Attheya_sp.AAC.2